MNAVYLKLFVDCLEKYQKLNDTEFGRLVRAALRYKATGAEPDDLGREALLWDGMRLDIDRDNENYANTVSARSEAGKKGAAARWKTETGNSKNSKSHLPCGKNGQEKDKDKDKEKEKEKEITGDIPPAPLPSSSPELNAAFVSWLAYKQERREAYKPTGLQSLVTRVEKAAAQYGDHAVADLIETCMAAGWKGIIFDRLEEKSEGVRRDGAGTVQTAGSAQSGSFHGFRAKSALDD